MRHIAATALTVAALAAPLTSAAQTARLGSLPPSAQIVTNASALQLTQAMLDALASTNAAITAALASNNAAITAALLARTNGWAQYDALIQQTNATVRLYQSETSLRWAWLTPTNLAVTTLTPTQRTESAHIVWSAPSAVPVVGATLRPVSGKRAAIVAKLTESLGHVYVKTAVDQSGTWQTGKISYVADDAFIAEREGGIAFHATGGGTVYAGIHSSSNLWRSADGGATWTACAAFPPMRKLMEGEFGSAACIYAGHVYSSGATVIAVPFSDVTTFANGVWHPSHISLNTSTNRWLRSTDSGQTWTEIAPDILWYNPAPTEENGYRDFDMYASAFTLLHETSDGKTINLNTFVHQSKIHLDPDVFHTTNVIRRLDGTNWTDHATLPSDMVNLRSAGGLYFGMPYSGIYHLSVTSQAAPRVSADLSAWQDTDLPASRVYDEPYEFFSCSGMWIAANGTNLWLSVDGASWLPASRPEDASGAMHAAAGRLYTGAGASQVRTGEPRLLTQYTSATVTLPLWGDWQSDVSAAAASAFDTLVTTGPLATTQHVAEAVGPLATTQQVAQAVAAVPTNYVTLAAKELHADAYTNLVWRSVYSNGWHWLVAHTNTPGGAE
jgi:hypothetical protein